MEISPEGSFRGGFIPQKTCNSLITPPLIPILIIPRSNFVPILIRHGRRLHSPSTPWEFRAVSRTQIKQLGAIRTYVVRELFFFFLDFSILARHLRTAQSLQQQEEKQRGMGNRGSKPSARPCI